MLDTNTDWENLARQEHEEVEAAKTWRAKTYAALSPDEKAAWDRGDARMALREIEDVWRHDDEDGADERMDAAEAAWQAQHGHLFPRDGDSEALQAADYDLLTKANRLDAPTRNCPVLC
jgi:hypothetical protein